MCKKLHLTLLAFILYLYRKERDAYYKRRAEAIAKPSERISIIVDGMDQSKTNLPHFKGWQTPKVLLYLFEKLKCCLVKTNLFWRNF